MSEKKLFSATALFLVGTICVIILAGFIYIIIHQSGGSISVLFGNDETQTAEDEQKTTQTTDTPTQLTSYGMQIRGTVTNTNPLTVQVRRNNEEPREIQISYNNDTEIISIESTPPKPGEQTNTKSTELNPATLEIGDIISVETENEITADATQITATKIIKLL